jgi:hypothetical protein
LTATVDGNVSGRVLHKLADRRHRPAWRWPLRGRAERCSECRWLGYDLTIDGVHTYYVLAGATPVLVHNCGSGAADLGHLTDRADDLHSLIPSGGQRYRTAGVLHADGVGGGIDLSAVGAMSNLTLIQRADSLDAGELAISMSNGAHAEVKLVTAAQHLGLNPGGIAASRSFCPACS